MARVWIQTEQCYRAMQRVFRDETVRRFIFADELVAVLNSAAEAGPDRHYVVVLESKQDALAD
jgi:hypothetical protein